MSGTAIQFHLPNYLRRAQIVNKYEHFFKRRWPVLSAMQDQHAALNVARCLRCKTVERTVDRDDSGELRAGFGELDRHRAAEAVADHCEPGVIDHRIRAQHVEPRLGAGAHKRAVGAVDVGLFPHLRHGLRHYAFAEHVGSEDHIAHGGHHSRVRDRLVGESSAIVEDKNARLCAHNRVVVSEISA